MLILDNFIHSDLHAGNIMVKFYKPSPSHLVKRVVSTLFGMHKLKGSCERTRKVETETNDIIINRMRDLSTSPERWKMELRFLFEQGFLPQIVLIDAGLVTTLNEYNRRNFLDLFRSIADFDGYRAGMLMIERSLFPDLAIDPQTFALKIQHLILGIQRKTFTLDQIKLSDILNNVLRFSREHHVKMEGDFINTILSVLLLEGIGRQLNPSLDLLKISIPIIRELGCLTSVHRSVESNVSIPESSFGAYLKVVERSFSLEFFDL